MSWSETIIAAHTSVTPDVRHSERLQSDRYFVWQEDGRNDLVSDNCHAETCMTGTTDLFTKQEFDPWAGQMEQAFDQFGIAWELLSIQYEPDTGFYHYEWAWEVL